MSFKNISKNANNFISYAFMLRSTLVNCWIYHTRSIFPLNACIYGCKLQLAGEIQWNLKNYWSQIYCFNCYWKLILNYSSHHSLNVIKAGFFKKYLKAFKTIVMLVIIVFLLSKSNFPFFVSRSILFDNSQSTEESKCFSAQAKPRFSHSA